MSNYYYIFWQLS